MLEPHEYALEAIDKMRKELGEDARFSSDEIWNYSTFDVPSTKKPGAISWLKRNGYIEPTGNTTRAVRIWPNITYRKRPSAGMAR